MEFIKKNLIVLVCGAISIISLIAIFIGQAKIASAKDALAQAQKYIDTINSLQRGVPVTTPDGKTLNLIPTKEAIEKLKEISNLYKAQGYQALGKALKINIGYDPKSHKTRRQLLLDGIFPEPVTPDKPFMFAKIYNKSLANLLTKLHAGDAPSDEDIERNYEIVAQDLGFLAEEAAGTQQGEEGKGTKKKYTEEDLKKSAIQKAIIEKANSIKIYCTTDALDIIQEAYTSSSGQPPLTEDMWWAQLSYWLQTDIIDAINQTNSNSKNVIESPVKRILEIKMMHGYVTPEGFIGRDDPGLPDSFTVMAGNKYYDVVRFSITVIIDARMIPLFIDSLYKEGYYTMYLCNIESIDSLENISRQRNQSGTKDLYYYGPSPVIKFTSYWETYLLRDFYHWGIIGYDVNPKTGKTQLILYNGNKVEVDNIEDRTKLQGLMPKSIRQLLTGEGAEENSSRKSRRKRRR